MPSLRSTLQTSAAAWHAKPHPRPRAMLWAAVCTVSLLCSGCAVVAVADAAVTVVSTTVKVGATVVGTTVDIGAAGVRAVVGKDED